MSDPLFYVRNAIDNFHDTCSSAIQHELERAYDVLVAYRDLGTVSRERVPQAVQGDPRALLEYLKERGIRLAAKHECNEKAKALKDEQRRLSQIHRAAEEEDRLVLKTQKDRHSTSAAKNGVKRCYTCSMPMGHPSKCIWPCNSIAKGIECPFGKLCHYRHHAPSVYAMKRASLFIGNTKIPVLIDCVQEEESDSVRVYINPAYNKNQLSRPLIDLLYTMAVKEHQAGSGQWILGTCNMKVKKIDVIYVEAFHHCPQCEQQ